VDGCVSPAVFPFHLIQVDILNGFRLTDYDYALPPDRIAQEPAARRDCSRLMVLDRSTGDVRNLRFFGIVDFFREGDLLVFNDTRVIPARLTARKKSGGRLEIFLLRNLGKNRWETLIRGKVSPGTGVILEEGKSGVVEQTRPDGIRVVRFDLTEDFLDVLKRFGKIPLPPYIRRNGEERLSRLDRERYQTVFARVPGAVAAPTAGLHFTDELLERIRMKGVETAFITLHVGYGTFRPVIAEDIREHRMDRESYVIPEETARKVNAALREGRRVIAVGTTSTRTLESATGFGGGITPGAGTTGLFIYPGYSFRVIRGLITNFHLPRTSLLMLVAAFAGKDRMDRAYRDAIDGNYRFYSYGDAMLIL